MNLLPRRLTLAPFALLLLAGCGAASNSSAAPPTAAAPAPAAPSAIATTTMGPGCAGCCPAPSVAPTPGASSGVLRPYPLAECLISGERLGSMGQPVRLVHGDQEILLCCRGCARDFTAHAERHLARLAALTATATAGGARP